MRRMDAQQPTSSNIYVGLIPFEWGEDNLRAVVCALGKVIDVRLGFDHIGKNKGFAFVEFETSEEAVNAADILSKTQVVNPVLGQTRRFRTQVSKEAFRSGGNMTKRVIPFDPKHMPAGVQFPPEALAKYPQLLWASQAQNASFGGPNGANLMLPRGVSHTPPIPGKGINTGSILPPSASNILPDEFLKATQFLAQPKKLPFATPDKINETLSQISPPQLIELIANLKSILASSDSVRAAEVFRLSPNLAAAATQALLLMGFIDEEVIQEAMKAEAANVNVQPVPVPTPPPQQQAYQAPYNQNSQHFNAANQPAAPYSQNYDQQARQSFGRNNAYSQNPSFGQNQGYNTNSHAGYAQGNNTNGNHSQRYGSGSIANQPQRTHLPLLSPAPGAPPAQSKWPHLPLLAQMKLANVPSDQAELIVQVLSLTPEQISALPPDRQNMVAGIKQQYL
ncbi:cleavage stimulation factor subunit 2 [Metschnikowia aff. pulcherrima]|uniref:Cleavage stimulation factor subunit 2 n=1 Tax=Metschnikowia aff. pulcherrima TaxID=2163413 RepID=A0A4P6XQX6_9ASCO|nr:cleavage stimulation factor subunit 2 [Metschnikowia aff. pulcherrima]